MRKKSSSKKKKNILAYPLIKQLILSSVFFICIVSVYFVDVWMHTKPFTGASIKKHIETLKKNEPIHIGKGFVQKQQSEKPLRIIIPRLNIDIPVVEAPIVDDSWGVSDTMANHGAGSAYPGQKGNMVIFAHARVHLFLPLEGIQDQDDVYVLTDKKWYAYKVFDVKQVLPEETQVIAPTKEEQLTLFTCTGFADEKRLIVVGKREESLAKR